jgi:hypothetical protein
MLHLDTRDGTGYIASDGDLAALSSLLSPISRKMSVYRRSGSGLSLSVLGKYFKCQL